VSTVLLLYHRPVSWRFRDASTVNEHVEAFARHSRLPVWSYNTALGTLQGLQELDFDAVVLHYSLFGGAVDGYFLDEGLRDLLARTESYKAAFFQDEHHYCQQRFAFLDRYAIDCVFTCLEPSEFGKVYGAYTRVPRLVSNVPGYVGEAVLEAARRFAIPDEERTIDVGYRGRPLAPYMGRGALEKSVIGSEFARRAAGSGLRLDIELTERGRLYGDDWWRFMASCHAMLGVESGVTVFDLEDEVRTEYEALVAQGVSPTIERLEEGTLGRWEGRVYYRTISPRHFEAAAFRVCQVLFEGDYSGAMEPMVHYIPLRKDFSNLDEVVRLVRDPEVRRELTERAHADLIASGRWGYSRLISSFDDVLVDAGLEPESAPARERVDAVLWRGRRRRLWRIHLVETLRTVRYHLAEAIWPVTGRIRRVLRIPPPPGVEYP
jgi:hypothetical protein